MSVAAFRKVSASFVKASVTVLLSDDEARINEFSSEISILREHAAQAEKTESLTQDEIEACKSILFAVLASLLDSISLSMIKFLDEIHPKDIALARYLTQTLFILPAALLRGKSLGVRSEWKYIVLGGFLDASIICMRVHASRHLPIATVSVIEASGPMMVAIIARIYLNEPCGIFHAMCLSLNMVGVVIISKLPLVLLSPSQDRSKHLDVIGILTSLIGTFALSLMYIVQRRIRHVSRTVLTAANSFVTTIIVLVVALLLGEISKPYCGPNKWLVIAMGLCSLFSRLFTNIALSSNHAGSISLIECMVSMLSSFAWQLLFFKDTPDLLTIMGTTLIVCSLIIIEGKKNNWLKLCCFR